MKNQLKLFGIITIFALIGFIFTTCVDTLNEISELKGTVTIIGNAMVGQTLTADTSALGGSGTISYQWECGAYNYVGENSRTYTVQEADAGFVFFVSVTRAGNTGSIRSGPTDKVIMPALTGTVSIAETSWIGQTLTADVSALGGSGTISYEWKRNGYYIGDDSSTYEILNSDESTIITVTVSRTGYSGTITSNNAFITLRNMSKGTPGLYFFRAPIGDGYAVQRGTANAAEIEIPEFYQGERVVMIADNGFSSYAEMTSIMIPKTVTVIGNSAFKDCSGLKSITIPDSVTSIGSGAFQNCDGLKSVTIPDSVIVIGNSAFQDCSGITSVTMPDKIKIIGNSAFQDCVGLTSITIPDSVEYINQDAFSGCIGLASVIIPDSVIGIGNGAFQNCSGLTSITISDSVSSIGNSAFQDCVGLTSVTIPDSVEYIGQNVFSGCSNLAGIIIPDKITSISSGAFQNCVSMTSLTIGNSVRYINQNAFSGCGNLTSLTIPGSVYSIGDNAFNDCTSLTRVTFAGVISEYYFSSVNPFPGDLRNVYFSTVDRGTGIYFRQNGTIDTWTGAPDGLTVSLVTSTSITFDWNPVLGAAGYIIYRRSISNSFFTEAGKSETSSFTNTGLIEGTTYYFRVAAVYSDGMSPQSNNVVTMSLPGIPTGVKAAAASSNSIIINWNSVSGAYGYRVYRSTSADGIFTEIAVFSSTYTHTDTGLDADTAYYYRVAAYNGSGTGEQSSVVNATPPGIPAGVSAEAESFTIITVSWSPVTTAEGYKIYRGTSANGAFTEVGTSAATSFTNTGLMPGTTYYYKVAAYNSSGMGSRLDDTVNAVTLSSPITKHPDAVIVAKEGMSAYSLHVYLNGIPESMLSYQWYSNSTASNLGGNIINGETLYHYTLPMNLLRGTYYYFVEVTVGDEKVRSNVTVVRVRGNFTSPTGIELVDIRSGIFTMGSPSIPSSPSTEPGRYDDEVDYQVTISKEFYIGRYEVTQEQYQAVTGVNPSYFHGGSGREPAAGEVQNKRPVEYVTWFDAVEFCNKLSERESLTPAYTITNRVATGTRITSATVTVNWDANGYRLPTEAEWEYACRAGTKTAYNTGDTSTTDTGWFYANSGSMTHEVGKKPANAWGLYDTHGNVQEWCWDWYGAYSYYTGSQTDPKGVSSGTERVKRGGSWGFENRRIRSAFRNKSTPQTYDSHTGLRVLRP